MLQVFVYGPLCHAPLLRAVLGHDAQTAPAILTDHSVCAQPEAICATLQSAAGAQVQGRLICGLVAEDLARLDHFAALFGHAPQLADVVSAGQRHRAHLYAGPGPYAETGRSGAGWSLSNWGASWGELVVQVAGDLHRLFPQPVSPYRLGPMLVRAASRLRAQVGAAPTTLRRSMQTGDIVIEAQRQPYSGFFAVEEYDLSFRRFDDGRSPVVTRAAFVSTDAVTVLPYDPVRDRVLLIEQFRTGPLARGDRQPWQLEAIAGRIDPGETPQDAARREAEEEAGLHLTRLLPIANYYPTPGAKTEFIYSFLALTDLPDDCAICGGEASEAEDIQGHLVPFTGLMDLVASGEVANAPLILTAFWLQRERSRLRGQGA